MREATVVVSTFVAGWRKVAKYYLLSMYPIDRLLVAQFSGHEFARLAQQEQEEELCRSKAVIEAELGKPVEIFAYPYGQVSSDRRALCGALKRAGYRAACLFPNPGGVSKLPIEDIYFLPRVPMFANSDLPTLLPS